MKVLLDECVDWRLLRDLPLHDVRTVKQAGLERLKNGTLLTHAAADFDVLITVDQNLPYQQNAARFELAVIVLRGRTTRLPDLRELLPLLHDALQTPRRGKFQILDWRDLPRPT